jgi:nucleoside-diphosphate-sugar epimerase
MKQRILVLGSGHFAADQVHAALAASDWATPVTLPHPATRISTADLEGVDALFNGTTGRPAAVLATARALHQALSPAVSRRLVHLSSMTVYGSATGRVGEAAKLLTDIGAYGAAQVQAEGLVAGYPSHVILRPGCEYGPTCPDWSLRIARLLGAHRLGDLGAAGDGVCNLLYVEDLVAAVLAALHTPGIDGSAFNLAMRSPPSWNEYFSAYARALGAVPVARIGRRRLKIETKLLAPLLKALQRVEQRLPGGTQRTPPALTSSLVNLCGQAIELDVTHAEQTLGMQWTTLADGLRQTVAPRRRT